MMTNLLHGAHVANKLFSTIARIRLLLVMFVALSVSVNVWAEEVTLEASCFTTQVSNYAETEGIIIDANENTWKIKGYGMEKNTSVTLGKGNANYLQTPLFSGNITKIVVTCSGDYYLQVIDNDGNVVCEQQKVSNSPLTFTVSGNYTQLKLFSKRYSSASNAATKITKVVVTYETAGSGGDPVDPTKYTINWHTAVGTVVDEVLEEGATITKPATDPTMSGYVFMGWTEDCEVASDGAGFTAIENFGTATEDKDYYAVFAEATTTGGGGGGTTEVTIDLSKKDQVTTNSTTSLVFTEGDVTFTNTKVSGQTDANNYSPVSSTARTSTRTYNGHKVTIAAGSTISKIVITAASTNYATAIQNATWTNGSASASSSTVTVTPSSGVSTVSFTPSATAGMTKVVVTTGGGGSTTYDNYRTTCTTQPTVYLIPKCGGGTWLVVIKWLATF